MKDAHIQDMQQDAFKRAEHEGYDFDGEVCDLFMGTFSDHARYFTIAEYIRMLLEDTPLPADVLQELKDRSGMTHLIYREWEKTPSPLWKQCGRRPFVRLKKSEQSASKQKKHPPIRCHFLPQSTKRTRMESRMACPEPGLAG